jgi:hypothetical protein
MKQICLFLLTLCFCSPNMTAETLTGTCGANGDNLTWSLDTESGVLTISGSGAMEDYDEYGALWPFIQTAVIEEGVISIGSYAFFDCSGLTSVTMINL